MDTKRTSKEGKTLLEFDSEIGADSSQSSDKDHPQSVFGISDSARSVLSEPKEKGRPKKVSTTILSKNYSSLREGAIQEYLELDSTKTPLIAYSKAGSIQAFSFLDKYQGSHSLFRYLFDLKQIKFQGVPERGDLAFLDIFGTNLALIHSFSARENKLTVFSKDEQGNNVTRHLPSWYCFGWFSE